jgi:2-oxoglutarate ferredoxin oxidoreductase subunit beta
LLVKLEGTRFVSRQSVHNSAAVRKAKNAIKKGFQNSIEEKGTSVVEIMSTCNSGWKMSPDASNKWMVEHVFPNYTMGDLKDE